MFGFKKSLVNESVRAEVFAGIELLDMEGPADWRGKIDVDELEIELADRCVLGQVYGSYFTGLRELAVTSAGTYGFSTPFCDDYPRLTREWKLALSA